MNTPTPTTTLDMVPTQLADVVSEVLTRFDLAHMLAGVLAMLAPHVTSDRPRPTHTDRLVLVDVTLVQRLAVMLSRTHTPAVTYLLIEAVRPFLPAQPRTNLAAAPSTPKPGAHNHLSCREVEVLVAMSCGRSNGAIGRALRLSEDTVKTHASRIYRKLEAHDRAHAVRRGFDLGYLTVGATINLRSATVDTDRAAS